MTPRQQKFVELFNGNTTKAARDAGYSKKTAYAIGHKLLKIAEIQEEIRKRQSRKSSPNIASREERQSLWSSIMRDKKSSRLEKMRAAEILGKSEGDFIERLEHSGNIDGGITIITKSKQVKI